MNKKIELYLKCAIKGIFLVLLLTLGNTVVIKIVSMIIRFTQYESLINHVFTMMFFELLFVGAIAIHEYCKKEELL